MSLLQNSYVFTNLFIKCLLKCFLWFLLHFINSSKLIDYLWLTCIQNKTYSLYLLLRSPSGRLSTRFDNELNINLKLSINFIICVIILLFSSFFSIELEKFIYFLYFLPNIEIFKLLNS